jgi:hypothetical protein
MANTYTIEKMTHMGDMRLTITKVAGDGSDTTIANTDIGLAKIQFAWLQDIDDGAALGMAVTSTTITLTAAITNGQYQRLFAIGW